STARPPRRATLFPYTTLFRSVLPRPPLRCELKNRYVPSGDQRGLLLSVEGDVQRCGSPPAVFTTHTSLWRRFSLSTARVTVMATDRKSTRLNSSHVKISYAVF